MGGRRWTDDDLRKAVAKAHSWRGVLRLLGLSPKSGGSIAVVRRYADRLDLDASHFSGTRRWSDRQLRTAISDSRTWDEVARKLGLVEERRTEYKLKGHALRTGIDIKHLQQPSQELPSVDGLRRPAELSELRTAAPAIVTSWCAMRGMPVAVPAGPQEYDLLITTGDGLQRVQVKSTTCISSNGKWHVGIGRRPYSLDKTAGKMPYDPDALDLFVVINGAGEIYVIPTIVLAGKTAIHLSAYEEYKVGDASSLFN